MLLRSFLSVFSFVFHFIGFHFNFMQFVFLFSELIGFQFFIVKILFYFVSRRIFSYPEHLFSILVFSCVLYLFYFLPILIYFWVLYLHQWWKKVSFHFIFNFFFQYFNVNHFFMISDEFQLSSIILIYFCVEWTVSTYLFHKLNWDLWVSVATKTLQESMEQKQQ